MSAGGYQVETDSDAKAMAEIINGSQPDPYYTPAQEPSSEDIVVYENYEQALGVVNDPDSYDEDTVDEILGTIRDDYKDRYSSYDGNYRAELSDSKAVQQFYREYKSKMAYYKSCVTKINNKEYADTREKQVDLNKARKYMPNNLGQEMKRLLNKVQDILFKKQDMDCVSDSE